MEQDISGLVLSVCVRMNQPFIDETGVNRVLLAEVPQSRPRLSAVEPVVSHPFIEQAGQHDALSTAFGGSLGLPSEELVAVEEEGVNLRSIGFSAEIQKSVLPEMLRVQDCIER